VLKEPDAFIISDSLNKTAKRIIIIVALASIFMVFSIQKIFGENIRYILSHITYFLQPFVTTV